MYVVRFEVCSVPLHSDLDRGVSVPEVRTEFLWGILAEVYYEGHDPLDSND